MEILFSMVCQHLPSVILKKIQNSAARLITRTCKFDSITPVLRNLHWLPIEKRIIFKINVLTFCAMHGTTPQYLSDLLHIHTPSRIPDRHPRPYCLWFGLDWTLMEAVLSLLLLHYCGMNCQITSLANKHYLLSKQNLKHTYLFCI